MFYRQTLPLFLTSVDVLTVFLHFFKSEKQRPLAINAKCQSACVVAFVNCTPEAAMPVQVRTGEFTGS